MSYWQDRLNKAQDKAYKSGVKALEKEYERMYKETQKQISQRMKDLYAEILESAKDGEIKPNDLYKFNRYIKLQQGINQDLKKLGAAEIKLTDKAMIDFYEQISSVVADQAGKGLGIDLTKTVKGGAEKVVNNIWCADSKSWSDRIWRNKLKLQQRLEKSFVDCIVAGRSKDEIIKEVVSGFGVGFNDADRIVRTELTHLQNEAASDRYKANGITKYQYMATDDDRTSEMCEKLDGKIFDLSEKKIGVNFPPLHPFAVAPLSLYWRKSNTAFSLAMVCMCEILGGGESVTNKAK